jgi:hypothetical protein
MTDDPEDGNYADVIAIDSGIIEALALLVSPPVSFTDGQLEVILIAAAALPRAQRDGFLRGVAAKLSAQPSDGEVRQAIAQALG